MPLALGHPEAPSYYSLKLKVELRGERLTHQYTSDTKAFARLRHFESSYYVAGRSPSAAMLIWFLRAIYRLDEVDAQDAVCDQTSDMGIDALVVEDDNQAIVLFQAKRKDSLPSTLGDTELKKFVGVLEHFHNEATVNNLIATTTSQDLRNLLTHNDVAKKVEQGYSVRLIFVSNVTADRNGTGYMAAVEESKAPLELWDLGRLGPVLEQLDTEWFVSETARLELVSRKYFVDGPKQDPRMVVAAVPARELVGVPGIDDTRIYAQNVRLSLGKTKVNREVEKSVADRKEHGDFVTFHNGLTVVAKSLKIRGNRLSMSDYSVCNGCQSLEIFYHNRRALTPELEVIVRFVRVGDDRNLAANIAYRTNNQNPVSLKDQSSNDAIQVQLKAEFDQYFGDQVVYGIKRGETVLGRELTNVDAGRLLLALYNCQPWSSHQKHRIFGDLYGEVFRYGRRAEHIRLADLMRFEIDQSLAMIKNERVRTYGLTSYLMLYLVGEVLREENDGRRLLDTPLTYLRTKQSQDPSRQSAVIEQIRRMATDLAIELDFYILERGESYDYKSEFKSRTAVSAIRSAALKEYAKSKHRGTACVFTLPA